MLVFNRYGPGIPHDITSKVQGTERLCEKMILDIYRYFRRLHEKIILLYRYISINLIGDAVA